MTKRAVLGRFVGFRLLAQPFPSSLGLLRIRSAGRWRRSLVLQIPPARSRFQRGDGSTQTGCEPVIQQGEASRRNEAYGLFLAFFVLGGAPPPQTPRVAAIQPADGFKPVQAAAVLAFDCGAGFTTLPERRQRVQTLSLRWVPLPTTARTV